MNGSMFGRRCLVAVGLLGIFSSVCAVPVVANAQLKPDKGAVIKRFGPLPDLVASVSAPAQINQGSNGTITIKLDNVFEPGPAVPIKSAGLVSQGSPGVNGVTARVFFVGFKVVSIQANSGLNCQPTGAGGTTPNTGVICSGGSIGAGASATITVTVTENGSAVHYCGPIYTDVLVDTGNQIAERSENNNRALAVTDTAVCIN